MGTIGPLLGRKEVFLRYTLITIALGTLLGGKSPTGSLGFFAVTDDKELFSKNPGRYDRVVPEGQPQAQAYYVERNPTLSIDRSEIDSLVITVRPYVTNAQEQQKTILGTWTPAEVKGKEEKGQVSYTLIFQLNKDARTRFANFSRKYSGQRFEVRYGQQRLALAVLEGNITEPGFSMHLPKFSRRVLEETFDEIRQRTRWKP